MLVIIDRADRCQPVGLAQTRFMLLVASATFADSANDDSEDGQTRKNNRQETYDPSSLLVHLSLLVERPHCDDYGKPRPDRQHAERNPNNRFEFPESAQGSCLDSQDEPCQQDDLNARVVEV